MIISHLDVVLVPGLVPEQQGGHAGEEAAEDAAEEAGLVEGLGVPAASVLVTAAADLTSVTSPVDQAGLAAEAAHAHPAVAAAVAQSLLPAPGHPEFCRGECNINSSARLLL